MRKKYRAHIALLFLIAINAHCKKDSTPPAPTALQVTVRSNTAQPVTGATVSIFADSADFVNNTNALMTAVSDGKGVVTFSNLSSKIYYFFAEDGCNNNFNADCVLKNPLALNRTTSVDAAIYATGSLKFTNQSADPYTVYVNGTDIGILDGIRTVTAKNVPLGVYSVRVVQNSGFTGSPTDETISANVSCGNTTPVSFP
jgi:hypothetical protein